MPIADGDSGLTFDSRQLRQRMRDAMITGLALVIPLIVTLIVLGFVLNFVSQTLNPAVKIAYSALGLSDFSEAVVKFVAFVLLCLGILTIGLVAQRDPENDSFESSFDEMMARIPGVGSIYTSFNEMSELLLSSESNSFREVKLVEFPTSDTYAVGFITANTSDPIEDAAGHDDLKTVFVPMAPNPVMGGFVLHVAPERLADVDMTVQEGIQSIVTSGVSVGGSAPSEISEEELQQLSRDPIVEQVTADHWNGDDQLQDDGERSDER